MTNPQTTKIVPLEPTDKQLDRAVSFMLNASISTHTGGWTEYARSVYSIMISAAPEAECQTKQ